MRGATTIGERIPKEIDLRLVPRWLLRHRVLAVLCVSLVILTLFSEDRILQITALVLCGFGLFAKRLKVDLWILVPFLVFDVMSLLSGLRTYERWHLGFAPTQTILIAVYLLMGSMDDEDLQNLRSFCGLWAAVVAAWSISSYLCSIGDGSAGRLTIQDMGGANGAGIFLAVGWFALLGGESRCLPSLEPFILAGLAMTLSMGSFLALAGGVAIVWVRTWGRGGARESFCFLRDSVARLVVGMSTGFLIYVAVRNGDGLWMAWVLIGFLVISVINWNSFKRFLNQVPAVSWVITGLAAALVVVVIGLRPGAGDTFTERLEMIASGAGHMLHDPVLGLGPLKWQAIDRADGGKFFGTEYIHNVYAHAGVELGLIAMGALIALTIRFFQKRSSLYAKGGGTAFFIHCMLDTGFFIDILPVFTVLAVGSPRVGGTELPRLGGRLLFVGLIVYFTIVLVASYAS